MRSRKLTGVSAVASFAGVVVAVAVAGCETPTHRTVRIHEYEREVAPDESGEESHSDSEMVSPGRMVSPGSMKDDR